MMRLDSILAFWKARTWLEKAVAALAALVLLLEALGGRPAGLVAVLEFAAVAAGAVLAFRYLRHVMARLMWRLRHRLLITYLFIGVVPFLLLMAMGAIAAYLFYGQVATYLVGAEMARIEEELAMAIRAVARASPRDRSELLPALRAQLPASLAGLPLQVEVLRERPAWLKDEFRGIVRTPEGHVIRAAVAGRAGVLSVSAPISQEMLSRLVAGIGTVLFLEWSEDERPASARRLQVGDHVYNIGRTQGGTLPAPEHAFDFAITGLLTEPVALWDAGPQAAPAALAVTTRPSLINARLFSTLGQASSFPLTVLGAVAIAFLVIEMLSLWIGVRLARSITRAVADLYEGTRRVHSGDLSGRIPVRSRDQLAELSQSFNTMTASVEQLIQEQKEKQRLLSELEIARDVQARLFPREAPSLGGLELAGMCQPARTVSGDYYDFVALDGGHLALAIGDIAGKGISAALVMASIQSMLHAQLYLARAGNDGEPVEGAAARNGRPGTAALVSLLNRQLQKTIAPGHFATFCFAMYSDAEGEITYTNAGHLPPVILRRGQVHRLLKGGTVLGIFPTAHYDQETLRLEKGDILVAFTDGITEPENPYGEEFGESRLLEILRRSADRPSAEIVAAVMNAVRDWTASPELQDDMTLLVARRL